MTVTGTTDAIQLSIDNVKGLCAAGESYASDCMAKGLTPVLSCEGPCIRGEIARLAANLVAREVPGLARACHAETFYVPDSTMARWVGTAARSVVIDGCFLKCHGRVLKSLIGEEKIIHIDALPLHRRYKDVFSMDDVPEDERKAVARQVADAIAAQLRDRMAVSV